jgi:hypothetical protein
VLARHEVALALPLCPQSAALSSAPWREWMGAGEEQSHRLYSCRRCAQQVRICRHCDRGNQYCAGECARIRRCESVRRAGVRYQLSHRGARCHAARQRVWRERQVQKVTHQGSVAVAAASIVTATSITVTDTHADLISGCPARTDVRERASTFRVQPHPRCCFCGRPLSCFARVGPLRGVP